MARVAAPTAKAERKEARQPEPGRAATAPQVSATAEPLAVRGIVRWRHDGYRTTFARARSVRRTLSSPERRSREADY